MNLMNEKVDGNGHFLFDLVRSVMLERDHGQAKENSGQGQDDGADHEDRLWRFRLKKSGKYFV